MRHLSATEFKTAPALSHFSAADNGDYYVEPYTLIGHEAADVMAWAVEHPDYAGSIEFERWDFEGSVDVREFFFPEADEAARNCVDEGFEAGTAIQERNAA